jgi:hypothetical protein
MIKLSTTSEQHLGSVTLRVAVGAACLLLTAMPVFPRPAPSCADIAACNPNAPDGEYVIATAFGTLPVNRHDMAGAPLECISLVSTATFDNFGMYKAGGPSPGTDVISSFSKLRLDPTTLRVNTGGFTFATSTGGPQLGYTAPGRLTACSCTSVLQAFYPLLTDLNDATGTYGPVVLSATSIADAAVRAFPSARTGSTSSSPAARTSALRSSPA